MDQRLYSVVTPYCPDYPSRRVASKDCAHCERYVRGILEIWVDCMMLEKPTKQMQLSKKRGRPAAKNKKKNGTKNDNRKGR